MLQAGSRGPHSPACGRTEVSSNSTGAEEHTGTQYNSQTCTTHGNASLVSELEEATCQLPTHLLSHCLLLDSQAPLHGLPPARQPRLLVTCTMRTLGTVLVAALALASAAASPQYETKWFTQELDHFDFSNTATFQQRYLISKEHWKPGGPVFFYTGNEGNITLFAENTGERHRRVPSVAARCPSALHLHPRRPCVDFGA